MLQPGTPLPEWSVEKIDDELIPQDTWKGKPTVLLFFSLGCPGCLGRAIPFANSLVHQYGGKINVVGIHTNFEGIDISNERLIKAKEEFYIRFPYFKDRNFNTTYIDYEAGGTPHWVIADSRLRVAYSIFGSDPDNALLRIGYKIDELLEDSSKGAEAG